MSGAEGNGIQPEFLAYVLPLIEGHHKPQFRNGVMRFTTRSRLGSDPGRDRTQHSPAADAAITSGV